MRKSKMKICRKCGEEKPVSEFYMDKDYIRPYCKTCDKRRVKETWTRLHKKPDGIIFDKDRGKIIDHQGCRVRIYWSPWMIDTMKRDYPFTRTNELADLFGISPRTVAKKAAELGLRKNKAWLAKIGRESQIYKHAYKNK